MKIEQNTELKKMAYKYQQLTDKLKKGLRPSYPRSRY